MGLLFFNFNHLITPHDFVGEEMRMGSIADLFCLSGCPSVVFTWQIGWSGECKTLPLLVWCLGVWLEGCALLRPLTGASVCSHLSSTALSG